LVNLKDPAFDGYLIFTEGEKKTLAGVQAGLVVIGLSGLWNWSNGKKELIPDFDQVVFRGRQVFIVPDSDWLKPNRLSYKKNLRQGVYGLAYRLIDRGARVFIIELPQGEGEGKVGLDDYLLNHTVEEFYALPSKEIQKKTSEPKKVLWAVTITEMLSHEFKLRDCVLYPWLFSQGICLIHSPRGVGKTLVGVGLAVAVAGGGKFLKWNAPTPFGVLYLDGEMPGVVLQERFALAIKSADKEPVKPLKIITPDLQEAGMPDLSNNEWQDALESHLEGISLIIVDNLSTLVRSGRENEGESWLLVQEWALRLRSRGYSIIFIHHDNKGGQQRGTGRKEDVLDTIIHLKRPGDYQPEERARFEIHFEKSRMLYGDDVKAFEAMLSTKADGIEEWALKDLEQSLTERVANLINDGVPQNEIAELLQVAKGTVIIHKNKTQLLGLLR
jgi:hypothetical protein